MSEPNWGQLRKGFPVCEKKSFFLSPAVGPLEKRVYEACREHLDMMCNEGDLHWERSEEKIESIKRQASYLLHCEKSEVGIGPNSSTNMNTLALMFKMKFKSGNVILPRDEFPASSVAWQHHGFEVRFIDSIHAKIDSADILSVIDKETVAVVHSHVQFATGFCQDLEALGCELKKRNVAFIVNATQSLGVVPIDVKKMQISALVASCHKWVGAGYGASLLFINYDLLQSLPLPLVGWLSQQDVSSMSSQMTSLKKTASVIEVGVLPFGVIWGLNQALKNIEEIGVNKVRGRILFLRQELVSRLIQSKIQMNSYPECLIENKRALSSEDLDIHKSGTLLIKVKNAEQCVEYLANRNILTSARSGGLRVGLHYYNNIEDLDRLLEGLESYADGI